MEDTGEVVFKFLFLFLCALCAFYYFIDNIFFRTSLSIQKYLSDGNFHDCVTIERVLTEQVYSSNTPLPPFTKGFWNVSKLGFLLEKGW